MGHIAYEEGIATPEIQAAHAAAFLSRRGRKAMASCPYHQPDWRRLIRILQEAAKITTTPTSRGIPNTPRSPIAGSVGCAPSSPTQLYVTTTISISAMGSTASVRYAPLESAIALSEPIRRSTRTTELRSR